MRCSMNVYSVFTANGLKESGGPEIANLNQGRGISENVGILDISMNNPFFV